MAFRKKPQPSLSLLDALHRAETSQPGPGGCGGDPPGDSMSLSSESTHDTSYNTDLTTSTDHSSPMSLSQSLSSEKKFSGIFFPVQISAHDPMRIFSDFISPRLFAEQWTLLDVKYFMNIPRVELIVKDSWKTPNWDRMLEQSNMLSRWIASQIVHIENITERVALIHKISDLMLKFWNMGNFNGCMCVWGGLYTTSVVRLHKTRAALPSKTSEIIDFFKARLSETANFSRLQSEMDRKLTKSEPFVPWLELLNKNRNMAAQHSDYLPNEEGENVNKNTTKLLNFEKIRLFGEQMLKFDKYQKLHEQFILEEDPEEPEAKWLWNYLKNLPTYDDEELWELSLKCEPQVVLT